MALNIAKAMLDPAEVFARPEQVRDDPALTLEQKIEVLRRWAYDDSETEVALEEGMPEGRQRHLQRRILLILGELTGDLDLEHSGPTKQQGLPSPRRTS